MKQTGWMMSSKTRGAIALRMTGLMTLLAVFAFLGACYWQPDDSETGLAVTLRLPAGVGTAGAGEIGALETVVQEDDSFVVLIALDDRFVNDAEMFRAVLEKLVIDAGTAAWERIDDGIGEFYWVSPTADFEISGATADSLYTSARVYWQTFYWNYDGNSGSHVFSGLRADSTYIVYAYLYWRSESNEGGYEGISRRKVQAGDTGTVSLDLEEWVDRPLEVGNSPVFQYMFDNYGLPLPPEPET